MASALEVKLALARGVGALSRLRGGGGTSAPGRVLMRLDPHAIGMLGSRLPRGTALVSGTNGKTTTATMLAGILAQEGIPLVHNRAGANMAGGIATTLMRAARPRGAIDGELGLFEVDELWLDSLAAELHPRAILLGNLFRDQLDRYGELETIAERWREKLSTGQLVLNADDPLIADLGRDRSDDPHPGRERAVASETLSDTLYYGVEDDQLALATMAHAADAKHCRRCGAPYAFEAIYLGHLGRYHCPSCGQKRPTPTVIASDVSLMGVRASRFTLRAPAGEGQVELELPGLYNVYNALAAAALATALEVSLASILAGLKDAKAAFGRAERVSVSVPRAPGAPDGQAAQRELRILLIKNPAGANEILRTLALEPGEHDLLGVLNDNIADGRDVSWVWDADFELLAGRIRRVTCSGTRAPELAVRFKYAGVDPARIHVQGDLAAALRAAAAERPRDDAPLYALPTYTAMLSLRELLLARGEVSGEWS
jgi:UDP-N-acetylmuramyl tripeptide synthase